MRLTKFDIDGYKRFVSAKAFVGRKVVAFVGPNEAGKSSLLEALTLSNNETPIPPETLSRAGGTPGSNAAIVTLTFDLSENERSLLVQSAPIEMAPTQYRLGKRANGSLTFEFLPPAKYHPTIEANARKHWPRLKDALEKDIEAAESDEIGETGEAVAKVDQYFQGSETLDARALDLVSLHLRLLLPIVDTKVFETATQAFATFVESNESKAPLGNQLQSVIGSSRPEFLQFGSGDRDLKHAYPLDDESLIADNAATNLLALAGTTPSDVLAVRNDDSRRATLQNKANVTLRNFFANAWGQTDLTVEVNLEPELMRVFVRDINEQHSTAKFSDRSEGLRLFVCLAAFLMSRSSSVPPVLLIDEAEQHLHLNAQADLVNLLQSSPQISQVLYTTHSPACLPTDLGSGVRFVEPSKLAETSLIRHDFWSESTTSSLGFSPLLFVMGAGAAAFATVRMALVAEGPSDMLLLPTMIRLATGLPELRYQIAPGIAISSRESLRDLNETASRVCYVVDGDKGGLAWKGDLSDAGIQKDRIRSLPKDMATEDLFDRSFYLDTINACIAASGKHVDSPDLSPGPMKSALTRWNTLNGNHVPGPIAVAEFVLGRHESGEYPIRLSARGTKLLQELHRWTDDLMENATLST